MAMGMRHLKSTGIFSTGVRQKLSNFGVVATILTMVYFDHVIGLDTPKLHVPKDFHVTFIQFFLFYHAWFNCEVFSQLLPIEDGLLIQLNVKVINGGYVLPQLYQLF